MGPFNMTWGTFMAFVVTAGSIVIAVAWALNDARKDSKRG